MFSDIDTNNLPNSWLMTISDSAEIKVCQGEESVEYTPDQFRSWYQRFGQMWHGNREEGKEEEYMKVHELHLEDGEMSVRLEMKLQIGVDEKAKVHDWNMIIGAKQVTFFNFNEIVQ
uniref:Activator of Hsp90 ATPase homolog 1-like protein n=1 Tax=Caenorhabditis tropicalis TaxID=1561998 RepID=A0A1I7UHI0_9PELO